MSLCLGRRVSATISNLRMFIPNDKMDFCDEQNNFGHQRMKLPEVLLRINETSLKVGIISLNSFIIFLY